MFDAVQTPDPYLTELASHLVVAGGKRLRPVVSVVAAAVGAAPVSDDVVRGGVACELVHLGSLYHDDVIDDSDVRRGVETVNAKWGNLQAILAGDFLLSRASEIAAVARHRGRRSAGAHDRVVVPGRDRAVASHLRHDAHRGELPLVDHQQDRGAVRHGGAHRRPGRRARPPRRRDAGPLGHLVRDGVPDRRRHPRHHRERRAPRQAGRPRHGGGRLHPSRPAHAPARPRGRRGAAVAARQAARPRRAGQGAGDRARQRGRRECGLPRRGGTSTPPRPRATTCRRAWPPTPCARRRPRCSRQPSRPRSSA